MRKSKKIYKMISIQNHFSYLNNRVSKTERRISPTIYQRHQTVIKL